MWRVDSWARAARLMSSLIHPVSTGPGLMTFARTPW